MNKQLQRIKIAEACGWKYVNTNKHTWLDPHGRGEPFHKGAPDYLNDLNAMHEAEMTLSGDDLKSYRVLLVVVCCGQIWHATAAQRAEAFLRTLNLWEDEQ